MAAALPTIASQQPVDLGGGFEDPMDPCTMCMQGQQEIQQAYNELTQTCNACQTQHNLTQLQQQGCQGCAQAQQVIQKVQQQSTGCASCGAQPSTFTQLQMPTQSQQPLLTTTLGSQPMQPMQGLVQPMLTPLVGTQQNILTTVSQQPGMMAGQLPIAIERGPMTPQFTQPSVLPGASPMMSPMVSQPMIVGTTPMPTSMQPTVTGMVTPPAPVMQPAPVNVIPMAQPAPVMQPAPVNIIPSPPQAPVMQPAPAPPPVQPTIQIPNLTPAQIAAAQQSVIQLPTFSVGAGGLPTPGGLGGGYAAGGGKAGPGAATIIATSPEGGFQYGFNIGAQGPAGGGISVSGVGAGIGGPGAFDVHRPDLHAGGGWHNLLPQGALQNVFNLY